MTATDIQFLVSAPPPYPSYSTVPTSTELAELGDFFDSTTTATPHSHATGGASVIPALWRATETPSSQAIRNLTSTVLERHAPNPNEIRSEIEKALTQLIDKTLSTMSSMTTNIPNYRDFLTLLDKMKEKTPHTYQLMLPQNPTLQTLATLSTSLLTIDPFSKENPDESVALVELTSYITRLLIKFYQLQNRSIQEVKPLQDALSQYLERTYDAADSIDPTGYRALKLACCRHSIEVGDKSTIPDWQAKETATEASIPPEENVYYLLNQAAQAITEKELNKALSHLTQPVMETLTEPSQLAFYYTLLAIISALQGNDDNANQHFNTACFYLPNALPTTIYKFWSMAKRYLPTDPEIAINYAISRLNLPPHEASALGLTDYSEEIESLQLVESFAELLESPEQYWLVCGRIQMLAGHYTAAMLSFYKAYFIYGKTKNTTGQNMVVEAATTLYNALNAHEKSKLQAEIDRIRDPATKARAMLMVLQIRGQLAMTRAIREDEIIVSLAMAKTIFTLLPSDTDTSFLLQAVAAVLAKILLKHHNNNLIFVSQHFNRSLDKSGLSAEVSKQVSTYFNFFVIAQVNIANGTVNAPTFARALPLIAQGIDPTAALTQVRPANLDAIMNPLLFQGVAFTSPRFLESLTPQTALLRR